MIAYAPILCSGLQGDGRLSDEQAGGGRRPAGNDASPDWLVRFRSIRPLTMVALGRLFLALFALITVHADPGQPSGEPTFTYGLIAFYLVFAWAVVALAQTRRRPRHIDMWVHAVDVGFFATLIHLTDGVTSPFFVYFTFALLAATLRWGWRGAAITAPATLVIYVVLALVGDDALADHVDRLIVRSSFLIFAGILFAYFAARVQHARLQIARLAAWPTPQEEGLADDPVPPVLAHAAGILRLDCIVVIWREESGVGLRLACFQEGQTHLSPIEPRPRPLSNENVSVMEADEIEALRKIVPESLCRIPEDGIWVVAPLPDCGGDSRVAMFTRRRIGRDFLPLASIVAMRIGTELERHALRRRLIEAAAAAERAKLAQDIHDDLLQAMTAVALQLKTIEDRCAGETARQIASAREIVSMQQRRLRDFVTASRDQPAPTSSLTERLDALAAILHSQWSCQIDIHKHAEDIVLPEHTTRHLLYFVSEAVANGVRHGGARQIIIEPRASPGELQLTIRDDGGGIAGAKGAYEHDEILRAGIGSVSLMNRAQDHGWRMSLETSKQGTVIRVNVRTP